MITEDNGAPHWLDQVVCVPTIGVRYPKRFRSMSSYLDQIERLFEALDAPRRFDPQRADFVDDGSNKLRISIPGLDFEGLNDVIVVAPEAMSWQTSYMFEVNISASRLFNPAPVPTRVPFTTLLSSRLRYLIKCIECFDFGTIDQFGVVASLEVSLASLPPGISHLRSHLAQPWSLGLGACEAKLLAILAEAEDGEWHERCHHHLSTQDGADRSLTLTLDWQRRFERGLRRDNRGAWARTLELKLADAETSALSYFHRFGAGDLQYARQ